MRWPGACIPVIMQLSLWSRVVCSLYLLAVAACAVEPADTTTSGAAAVAQGGDSPPITLDNWSTDPRVRRVIEEVRAVEHRYGGLQLVVQKKETATGGICPSAPDEEHDVSREIHTDSTGTIRKFVSATTHHGQTTAYYDRSGRLRFVASTTFEPDEGHGMGRFWKEQRVYFDEGATAFWAMARSAFLGDEEDVDSLAFERSCVPDVGECPLPHPRIKQAEAMWSADECAGTGR